MKKYRKNKSENIDEKERRTNFSKSVLFGPIFICSCCSRRLYENGVVKVTSRFEDKVNKMKPNFYNTCILQEKIVKVVINEGKERTGIYICTTCKTSMMKGKVPAMATINGLQLVDIDESCQLTEQFNSSEHKLPVHILLEKI